MTLPALPALGSTSWYTWAQGVDSRARNSGTVNVKDYGAVGDGTTDDGPAFTAAINAALAAIPRTNGGGSYTQATQVIVPAGAYRIATPVSINLANASNTTSEARRRLSLVGAGDGHTVLLLRAPAGQYGLSFRGGMLTLTGMSLVGDATTGSYGLNLGADNAEAAPFINQFRISDCTFRDMYRFVNLAWAFDGQFTGVGFSNLAAGGTGFNVPTHSTDNCNNVQFFRCHWEPATAGGTLLKIKGGTGAAQLHAMFGFTGCHFETRSFATTAVDLELIARVTFTDCQITQNADPSTAPATSAVPVVRIVNCPQVVFNGSSIMRDVGTGFPTKLLRLGGSNRGLTFVTCFFFPGDAGANAGKSTVWAADPTTALAASATPFRLVGSNINDATAAEVPDEVIAVANPDTTAEMWTQRFDATTKRQIWGYGAAGGDWASGRADRMFLANDGGLGVGSYLASAAQATVAAGATQSFAFYAANNVGRRGFYLIAANDEGDAFALVYSSAQALWPISVGSKFAVGTTDPGTASKFNVFLNGFDVTVTNRTAAAAPVMVLPVGFI